MTHKVPIAGDDPARENGHKRKIAPCDYRTYGVKRWPHPSLGTNARAGHGGADEMRIRREQERFMGVR